MDYELTNPPSYRNDTVLPLPMEVTADAWAVDAACSGNPGPMEYRGIDLATGAVVFHYGPVHGTNNIGEFLAIVHALALMEQKGIRKTIYSDSTMPYCGQQEAMQDQVGTHATDCTAIQCDSTGGTVAQDTPLPCADTEMGDETLGRSAGGFRKEGMRLIRVSDC